jgi:hypothetical protein
MDAPSTTSAPSNGPRRRLGALRPRGATDGRLQRDRVLPFGAAAATRSRTSPACRSCNASKCNDEITGWMRRKRLDEQSFLLRHLEIKTALVPRCVEPESEPTTRSPGA